MAYSDVGMSQSEEEKLLKTIHEEYREDCSVWDEIRKQGDIDIRYSTGDTWDEADQIKRKGRLMMKCDETGQYTNQVINESRQNKRSILVTGTTFKGLSVPEQGELDKLSRFRAERIRQIEHRSNASQAYTALMENAVLRGVGWLRIETQYLSDDDSPDAFEQDLVIRAIPNPNLVTPGPHVMPDGSDLRRLWYEEEYEHDEYLRMFPWATVRSFEFETQQQSGGWIQEKNLRVAEYWCTKVKRRELLLIQDRQGQTRVVFADQVKGHSVHVLKRRTVDAKQVCQYVTNGVEILSKTEWPEPDIPFVPCYGPVYFVTKSGLNGGTKREIHSMLRKARDPAKMLNWLWSTEAEVIQRTPKIPWFVRRGALNPNALIDLSRSSSDPVEVIEVEAELPLGGMQGQPPEFPTRGEYEPPIQAFEFAKESARRAIQSAMAVSPLPTQAQKRNEKSGIALEHIQEAAQVGSYHFYDHQQDAIMRTGLLINNLLRRIDDGTKDVTLRDQADKARTVTINDPNWQNPETGKPEHIRAAEGRFDVTIGTGPKVDSERQAASEFADQVLSNPNLAQIIGPEKYAEVLSLAIKLKNVGPLGEQIAEIISPSQNQQQDDPRVLKAKLQELMQNAQMMSQELEKRTRDAETEQAKIEGQRQTDVMLQDMKSDLELAKVYMDNATKIRIAELNAATKGLTVAAEHEADHEKQALGHSVEIDQANQDRALQVQMAERQHQQGLEAGDVAHQQALEQSQVGHEQALEQGAQAAALAPEPAAE